MKTTLSLTALGLLATSLLLPMQASAADRQISVNPKPSKIQTFTVENDDQQAVDVAATETDKAQQKVTPKAFRVDDKPVVTEEAANEDATDTPEIAPPKKKTFRFRVEDQSEQAAATPSQEEDQDVAVSEDDRPAKLLNEKVKLVKKQRPAPIENNDDEATADETDHSAEIADDTSDETVDAPVVRQKHRMYYYAKKQNSYEQAQDDYSEPEPVTYSYRRHNTQSYQPRYYAGSSCRNSYNGY